MTTSLEQLLADRAALDQKIKELQIEGRKEAIAKALSLIDQHDLKEQDLFPSHSVSKAAKTSSKKVAAKYLDPISGATWSGRGLAPKWLAGKNRDEYLIA